LLNWKKEALTTLIPLLALPELAPEVRQIVDKKQLMCLYDALTPLQKKALKFSLHQQIGKPTSSANLRTTLGREEDVKRLLNRIGMKNFSLAFSGEHPDLVWHIAMILDVGRGSVFIKQFQENQQQDRTFALAALLQAMRLMAKEGEV
jgi:hypothetical protein